MAIVRGYKGNWGQDKHPLLLIDIETGETLGLQGLPDELDYNPSPTWATISIPGRNAPWYTYVGSEDVLTLEISWYAKQENLKDVIAKCRWIEALTKADSYDDPPHRCRLKWGELFSEELWIVSSASYRLKNFDAAQGYRPHCATQQVVLKKWLPHNTTQQQINGEILIPPVKGAEIKLTSDNLYAGGTVIDYGDGTFTLEPSKELIVPQLDDETYIVKDGDTLDDIANRTYGNSKLWHILAKANQIDDAFSAIRSGLILRIPNIPGIAIRRRIF